jgi:acetyl-CoA C-acetyltransferase
VTGMEVAVVGVGLHPFGRHPGVTGIEMGAIAIRRALADAGVEWKDIQFAFAGSYEIDNPDAVVALLGLTGIPFTDVYNGCATAASALTLAADTIRLGEHGLGIAVGMDKHLPGAFSADPRLYACPSWYGETGQFLTTKFFGMKINKYMHDHGISRETLAKVAAKNYRHGVKNPNAFRRKALSEEEILGSPVLNHPLTQYMFCSPDEGAAAVVVCRAEDAHRYTDAPVYLRATKVRTRRLGAFEVHSPWLPIDETPGPTVDASRAAYEAASIGPEDVDVIQLQDTDAGAEVIHLAENGFCGDGEQEELVAAGELEIDGRLPVNTDGGLIANGEPIGASGLRQVHEIVLQLRGRAGDRQVPGAPKVGYTQLYGAPGTAGVSILSV